MAGPPTLDLCPFSWVAWAVWYDPVPPLLPQAGCREVWALCCLPALEGQGAAAGPGLCPSLCAAEDK